MGKYGHKIKISSNLLEALYNTLAEKCPHLELFWSAFSRIRIKYGEILGEIFRISPHSVRTRTRITPNTDTFYAVTVSLKVLNTNLILHLKFKFREIGAKIKNIIRPTWKCKHLSIWRCWIRIGLVLVLTKINFQAIFSELITENYYMLP